MLDNILFQRVASPLHISHGKKEALGKFGKIVIGLKEENSV